MSKNEMTEVEVSRCEPLAGVEDMQPAALVGMRARIGQQVSDLAPLGFTEADVRWLESGAAWNAYPEDPTQSARRARPEGTLTAWERNAASTYASYLAW